VARISEETIQRVAEANDIVEVISSYFPLKRAGSSWRALCPFHREKTPSFHVNPQRQSYHCFGCGAGGTVFRFVMEYEHVDFPSAVRRLAQRAGVPVIEEAGSGPDDRTVLLRKRLLALHAEAASWFHENLLKSPNAETARTYLQSRKISAETARSWLLGYAPESRNSLLDHLRGQQFSSEEITQSGLALAKEEERESEAGVSGGRLFSRFRGRLMFPIRNDYGEVIAFSGRVLDPTAKTAKYVNSPDTPLFNKGRVLYGLDKSKRALIEASTAIVCEGQIDVISAFEAGIQNVIAPQGTAFTSEQARLLRRFVETVILCFDSDQAGQKAIGRSLPALLGCGLEVRVASLPEAEDPDSLIRSKGVAPFREILHAAPRFFDYALEHLAQNGSLENPAGKLRAARKLGPYVAAITDTVLRESTARSICARLGITEAAFTPHVKPATFESDTVTVSREIQRLPMQEGVRQLCRLSLIDPETRAWLAKQSSFGPQELGEGGDLLRKILESSLALEQPSARAAFMATLLPAEEIAIRELDLDRPQENSLLVAQDHWIGLYAQHFQEQSKSANPLLANREPLRRDREEIQLRATKEKLEAAKSRLQDMGLEATERKGWEEVVANLTKQILDLQSRLNDV
jgi:DNA primase